MSSISINKNINKILKNDEQIKAVVGDKIFPLVANQDTTFPFIYHNNLGTNVSYTKDGHSMDDASFSIVMRDNLYIRAIETAERVRKIFENRRDDFFKDVKLIQVLERYNDEDDTFSVELQFEAIIF